MICCTRSWFAFRIDCSSAYTLNAVTCCGGVTPVLRVLLCASWISRTSSRTWLLAFHQALQRGIESRQLALRRLDSKRPRSWIDIALRILRRHSSQDCRCPSFRSGSSPARYTVSTPLRVYCCRFSLRVQGYQHAMRVDRLEEGIASAARRARVASANVASSRSKRTTLPRMLSSSVASIPYALKTF